MVKEFGRFNMIGRPLIVSPAASRIPVVVAVSCNVATFARDARILIDGGYKVDGVTPVDQFRHTPHVELVARFRR